MSGLHKYSAVHIAPDASIRRISFEAATEEEARSFAVKYGFGFEGEAEPETSRPVSPDKTQPEAYSSDEARRILGGISRKKLYALRATGKLEQLPDTRRVLVTRKSIQKYLSRAA
jgi:hypothetical protein